MYNFSNSSSKLKGKVQTTKNALMFESLTEHSNILTCIRFPTTIVFYLLCFLNLRPVKICTVKQL